MRKPLSYAFLMATCFCSAQSVLQTVNSGSLIASSSSVSVGEIIIDPINPNQASSSGIIGILAQTSQTLEVAEFELSKEIVAYPNPTLAGIYFKSNVLLANQKVAVYTDNGQLVAEKTISADNGVDLSGLATGIYIIQLSNEKTKSFKIIKH